MADYKLLLTGVFGPYGIKSRYAEGSGMQMELLNNQITRCQGIHSPRQSYWTFPLYLLAENISIPSTVLDFPSWKNFTRELENGYTHVGINFIAPNVLKAGRMAQYIRKHYPDIKIILGGYGTAIPNISELVPNDEICMGEGVQWLRNYFGETTERPVKHPVLIGPAYEYLYGIKTRPRGGILLSGVGCENGCNFCMTSHHFNKTYLPLLKTGTEVYKACVNSKIRIGAGGFSIMDENFLKSTERARELLREMTKNLTPFVFDIFSSAEIIRQVGVDFLVRLGVRMIWIGVESQAGAYEKNKGIDHKGLIGELQSKGISVNASGILFLEHHTRESLEDDINWIINLGSDFVQFMNYTPLPLTELYRQMEKEGRLKKMGYQYIHGQGELNFIHPHINDPREHHGYLKKAFKDKYIAGGPAVLNMASTAVKGYRQAVDDYLYRHEHGLQWNDETLAYEESGSPEPDEFMLLRIRKMQKIAKNLRPILPAAYLFSPNSSARNKAKETIRLYRDVLGKMTAGEKIASVIVVLSAMIESVKLSFYKLRGLESIVRQPPMKQTEFPSNRVFLKNEKIGALVLHPTGVIGSRSS